jgi:hypothetical protein
MPQAERPRVRFPITSLDFSIDLILSAVPGSILGATRFFEK